VSQCGSQVKRIIDNNNGIIEVESEEDKGTIIRIFLKEEIF
jgi:signal transduction histidine kinase